MISLNKFLILGALAASVLIAACGSSSNRSGTGPQASGSAPSSSGSASASTSALSLTTAKGSMGTYLAGAGGRALYIWAADSKGKSSCSGACAKVWPPLTTSSMPKIGGVGHAADLSLISRSGGVRQVAYMGHPLYYYAGDAGAGSTNGQGSDQFGAKWWLISPAGGEISGTTSAGSSGSSYGGGR